MKSGWMWIPKSDPRANEFALFCRKLDVLQLPKSLEIKISADSRYKFYVNDTLVEFGPSKGNQEQWYYDEIDLAPHLHIGSNVLVVQVLHYQSIIGGEIIVVYAQTHRGSFSQTVKHVMGLPGVTGSAKKCRGYNYIRKIPILPRCGFTKRWIGHCRRKAGKSLMNTMRRKWRMYFVFPGCRKRDTFYATDSASI